jgi:hypothetical protein
MNRIFSDTENYKILRILDEYNSQKGLSFSDSTKDNDFLAHLNEIVNKHRSRTTLIHGLRIQALFGYMAASLGKCKLIIEEDSGDFYSKTTDIIRPDFKIVLDTDEQYLIEVKNYHQTNPKNSFKIKKKYLDSLLTYSDIQNIGLKFAIYWTKWKTWTLIDPKHFALNGNIYHINLTDAYKCNEMNLIGDCLIATVPPLSLKLETATISRKDNDYILKIQNAYLLANGNKLEDKVENKIASFLLFYGRWNRIEQPAEVENGNVKSFEIQAFPDENTINPGCSFQMIGNLSEMLTNQFNLMTTDSGEVKNISSKKQPTNIKEMIPENYNSDSLKLWRFTIKPHESLKDCANDEDMPEVQTNNSE